MYTVENKFEIGEECYSVYRKPTHYKCPICEGNGKFPYKGYEIWCKNCSGSGKLHNPKQSVMAVCKVKVRRLIASIWQDQITIKYKVDGVDEFKLVNVRNRGENNLFKTKEEAEKYCVDVNNIKNAVVTTMQARDIKALIPWIHIIKINPSPKGKNRSYILE